MARSRTTERKRERERQQRRQRRITLIIAVVALLIVAVAVYFLSTRPAEAPIPAETAARYDGVLQTRTQEGYPRLGSPDALLPVSLYCTFDSPLCSAFYQATIDPLVERVREGDVSVAFVPLFTATGNSRGAARAAVCAGEQQAFWPLADAFYLWLNEYGAVQAFTGNRIQTGVAALGLNTATFAACAGSDRPDTVLTTAASAASALPNFRGVGDVTVAINGAVPLNDEGAPFGDSEEIIAAIDTALAAAREALRDDEADEEEAELVDEPELAATDEPTAEAAVEPTAEADAPDVTEDAPAAASTGEAAATEAP